MFYAVTYSYATWDPHYRGQRGVRVEADSEQDALRKIREGTAETGYGPCPSAQIVRAKLSARQ